MQPLPDSSAVGGYLLPTAIAAVLVLVPLFLGGVVGYRTVGRTSDRLRAGARAGAALTVLATAGVGLYAFTVLPGASGYDVSTLLTLLPTLGIAWVLFAGLYSVCVSVIGSVLGGYIRRRATYASA
ncbi:hypothetical protein [Haloglomus litoreum]|uniref:hypothetical protein n=1 Tax=Haloglomus litoreum TaxID=3034026 RepID=UPI0023E7B5DC|nr:hypothetical protein [Haloglomus sp. DT116]